MSSERTKIHLLPEAQATSWDELMPPVQTAVSELLFRIQAAHQSIIPEKNESTSNTRQQAGSCFLVYGSRGTGKTSVLLNAQRAVNRKLGSEFFNKTEEASNTETKNQQEIPRKDAQEKARKATKDQAEKLHKDIVWLDILNLEPLPSEANLLTVLLTKIRSALNSQSDSRHSERRSVFEEEADSARQLLTNLINDATYMWDNVKEADTRNLSQRQVKAAEIYTGFQERFKKAMDKLVKELQVTPSSDNKLSIVLPIDNIDRSTDHLQSIVKLAQLVAHPNLWLVMAGDRVEVETFLERAYWKELIKSSDGAGARGKMDSEGEDETLAMARRQANATAQKLWPTNHRVEVNLVSPKETLMFKYRHHSDNKDIKDIRALLGCLQIPTMWNQRKTYFKSTKEDHGSPPAVLLDDENRIALIDLFDVTDKVKDDAKQNNDESMDIPYLTRAAQHGLLLPARNVLDLWQLLHCLVEDKETSDDHLDFEAEKVARTMLRIAIASSSMINEIAQDLQTDILRRGENGGTILYFVTSLLDVTSMTSANHDFEHALEPVFHISQDQKYNVRSQLVIRNIEDMVLKLKYKYSPIEPFDPSDRLVKDKYPQPFVIENANERQWTELPPQVAAWLMILYDILILAEAKSSSWVLGNKNVKIQYPNVSIDHTVVELRKYEKSETKLYWNPPNWVLFWGRNIFSLRWQDFRRELAKRNNLTQGSVPELLAAGWIFCVLKTSVELIKASALPKFSKQFEDTLEKIRLENGKLNLNFDGLMAAVMTVVIEFYKLIQQEKKNRTTENLAAYEIIIKTGKWIETEFVYFFSSAYVPVKKEDLKDIHKAVWDVLKGDSALKIYWKDNLPFIWAELNKQLPTFDGEDHKDKSKTLAELLFADLYQYLETSDK